MSTSVIVSAPLAPLHTEATLKSEQSSQLTFGRVADVFGGSQGIRAAVVHRGSSGGDAPMLNRSLPVWR